MIHLLLCDADLVEEGGVVSTGAIQALEADRMSPSGDGERGRGVALVRRTRWCERAHHDAVDQHVKVLPGRLVVATLGSLEGEHVAAGCPTGDTLAEGAGCLEDGDLDPLGCGGITSGEAAVVAGDARVAGEGPG